MSKLCFIPNAMLFYTLREENLEDFMEFNMENGEKLHYILYIVRNLLA